MNYYQMLMSAMQGAQNPDTAQTTADQLARAGDPNAVAPLFEDANTWSPTKFDNMFEGAQLSPMTPPSFNGAPAGGLGQSKPALAMTAPQAGAAIPGAVQPTQAGLNAAAATQAPGLTPQQMQELFGMAMKPGGPTTPPMPATPGAAGRPVAFNANMGAVQAPGVAPLAPRPTLAQLIFGR